MRVLVFGGRDYKKHRVVRRTLSAIHAETPITKIIEGGAPGADRFGRFWAKYRGIEIETYEADWFNMQAAIVVPRRNRFGDIYNAAAGNLRNMKMLKESEPDMAVEFPGGKGTADMRRLVQKEIGRRGLRYLRIEE